MNSDQVAYLALLVSIISVVISLLTLSRDRHVLVARGSIYEADKMNTWNLSISVSNKGKRPVSVCFVTIRPKGHPGGSMPFRGEGANVVPTLIDVGGVAYMNIEGNNGAGFWNSSEEIRACRIFVQDALGKDHLVNI